MHQFKSAILEKLKNYQNGTLNRCTEVRFASFIMLQKNAFGKNFF